MSNLGLNLFLEGEGEQSSKKIQRNVSYQFVNHMPKLFILLSLDKGYWSSKLNWMVEI